MVNDVNKYLHKNGLPNNLLVCIEEFMPKYSSTSAAVNYYYLS